MAFVTRLPLIGPSVTQFSDVYPTDWAYQALANFCKVRLRCRLPQRCFRGNRAMTRYEAAALLNASRPVTEVTDELRRLLKESKPSWPSSRAVDGLEAKAGELAPLSSPPPPSSVKPPL